MIALGVTMALVGMSKVLKRVLAIMNTILWVLQVKIRPETEDVRTCFGKKVKMMKTFGQYLSSLYLG